jgi:predicted transcriptional regulator
MEVCFSPEFEAELKRVASENGRAAEQLVQEIVQTYLSHDQWFKSEVQKGLNQLDRVEFVDHEEVVERIEFSFKQRNLSTEEFEAELDGLAAFSEKVPALSLITRDEIYRDHD